MSDHAPRPANLGFPPLDVPADLQPEYVNLVRISHTPAELVMDFARLLPGDAAARVCSRLMMSPVGAKLFFRALADNLARYEAAFGEIAIPGDPNLVSELFRGTRPPEPPRPPGDEPKPEP
jgi:hypothetical protein